MNLVHHNIAYSKVGNGPHLCFLHGFCENKSVWEPVITDLQKDFTCISIDLPGFGDTQEEIKSISQMAEAVMSVLSLEDVNQVVVFGHSMGGYVALELLSQSPSIFSGIGLVHSTAKADTDEKKSNRMKTIDFVSQHGTKEFFDLFAKNLVSPAHFSRLHDEIEVMIKGTSTNSIVAALLAMIDRKDHVETLANANIPALFTMGDKDQHLNLHDIFNQASQCRLSQVDVIENCGHLSMLEDKKNCLKSIRQFLKFISEV